MSIVRKNLRAKKGKKNWRRNIDTTEFERDVELQKQREKLEQEAKQRLMTKAMFYVDEKPDAKIRQRVALDPNRFKKKHKELTATEDKHISKLAKKVQKREAFKNEVLNAKIPAKNNQGIEIDDEIEDEDFWAEEKEWTEKPDELRIPVVLPPHEGQSYNPTFKAHKELLQQVVDEEIKKEKRKNENPEYERNRLSDKNLKKVNFSKKERREAREKEERKAEKKQAHDIMYIKKIKKEIEAEEAEKKRKLEEKAQKEAEERKLVAEGKIIRTMRLNRNVYHHPGTDFQLASDLKANLRSIKVTGSLARERFDSIFRRNLIERTSYEKKKKRKGRIPKVKYHNTERGVTDDFGLDDIAVHK